MNQDMNTSKWITFFMEAGMPASMAANYAVLFYDNRIQRDMLLDLNKEVLNEMGIRAVGDVIAILKHAKVAYAQAVTDRVNVRLSTASKSKPSAVTLPKLTARPLAKPKEVIVEGPKLPPPIVLAVAPAAKSAGVKRVRTVQPPAAELQSAKKPRRLDPEEEGSYSISMPLGTTPRSTRILQKTAAAMKKSVFDRLGESVVSSSTDTAAATAKFKAQNSSGGGGVFARLGHSAPEQLANGPVLIRRVIDKPLSQLVPSRANQKPLAVGGARRLPENSSSILLKSLSEITRQQPDVAALSRRPLTKSQQKPRLSVKQRLTTGGITKPRATKTNVKQRLGIRPQAAKTTAMASRNSSSVFSRLGVARKAS